MRALALWRSVVLSFGFTLFMARLDLDSLISGIDTVLIPESLGIDSGFDARSRLCEYEASSEYEIKYLKILIWLIIILI